MLLTQDVEKFGTLQKPRDAKGEHRDRFAHKHGVVVIRPACGERDTCDNGDPDDDGAAPMDSSPRGTPARRTILALSIAIAEAESRLRRAARTAARRMPREAWRWLSGRCVGHWSERARR